MMLRHRRKELQLDEVSTDSNNSEITDVETAKNDETSEKEAHDSDNVLEEVIMSWTKKRQHKYLKALGLPIHGTKTQLTWRIMSNIPIKEAIEVIREHKRNNLGSKISKGNSNNTEDKEMIEVEMEKIELVLKRKREDNKEQYQDKTNLHREKKSTWLTPYEGKTDESMEEVQNMIAQDKKTNEKDSSEEKDEEGDKGRKSVMMEDSADILNGKLIEVEERQEDTVEIKENSNSNEKEKIREDNESVATTRIDNIKKTRIGLMMTLPPSTEPDKCLTTHLQEWFKKMSEIDKKFTVLSWKTEDGPKYPIKGPQYIPNTISRLRTYFFRVQARSAGGKVYADVFIQHSLPIDDIKGDAEWFLKEKNMAIYKKQLQVEETSQLGWLLYSTQSIDIEVLAAAIEAEIGTKVALRWKYINSNKYIADKEERKKWMATHIEVDTKDVKKAKRGLNTLYGSKSTCFPLGIRMRLVSEFREVRGNSIMMSKHTRLRVRQASFISLIDGYPTDDIQMLDYEDEGQTLRDMIMSIQSRNPQTPGNLFHAVGRDWKGRIIFNYLRNKADEACMIIDGILPYLQYHHGSRVNLFFDPEAVIEKEDWRWDDEKGVTITPLSDELEGLETIDDDYNFIAIEGEDYNNLREKENTNNELKMTSAEESAVAKLNLVVTGKDEDSVSTIGNPMTPANLKRAQISNMIAIRTNQSGSSSVTDISLDTRMSVIEQRIMTMEQTITRNLEKSMTKLMERMTASPEISVLTQPPGGEAAGQENE